MKKRFATSLLKSLCIVFALLLACTPINISPIAQLVANAEGLQTNNSPDQVELVERRTENETFYQNADGSITYESHLEPIRYQDESGLWQDIDTDIVKIDKSETSTDLFKDNSNYSFRTKKGKQTLLLADDLKNEAPILLEFEYGSISSRPLTTEDAAKLSSQVEKIVVESKTDTTEMSNSELSLVEKTKLEDTEKEEEVKVDSAEYNEDSNYCVAEYDNAFGEGTSLRLRPTSQGYKEDIELQSYPGKDVSYSYLISAEGVELVLGEQREVFIVDKESGEQVGYLTPPYMYDSSKYEEYEHESYDIDVSFQDLGNGTYLYTLTPDQDYLLDERTVYPVYIDPTTTISGPSSTYDSDVKSSYPDSHFYLTDHLRVGQDTSHAKYRTFIKFTLPGDLSGAYVKSATLGTYQAYSGSTQPPHALYKVTQNWTSSGITWNNQPSTGSTYYQQQVVQTVKWYYWNMKALVQEWADGYPNYGLCIKSLQETLVRYKRYRSSDYSSYRPYLTITYYPVDINLSTTTTAGSTNSSVGSIRLNWTAPPSDSGLSVRVWRGSSSYSVSSSATSYTFSNVSAATSHTVKVQYYDSSGYSLVEQRTVSLPDTCPPGTLSQPNVTVTNGASNSGNSATIRVYNSNGVTDVPSGAVTDYRLMRSIRGGAYSQVATNSIPDFTLSAQADNTNYSFKVRAYDSRGNYSESAASSCQTADKTAPVIDASDISITPNDWTDDTTPTFTWHDISDEQGDASYGVTYVAIQIDSTAGSWTQVGSSGQGSYDIPCSALNDGQHTIYIRAKDAANNTSNLAQLIYKKDTVIDVAGIDIPMNERVISGNENGIFIINAQASDAHLASWSLDYALALEASPEDYINIVSGTSELLLTEGKNWQVSGLQENRFYTLRLTVTDSAGNDATDSKMVLYSSLGTEAILPSLDLTLKDENEVIIGEDDFIASETVNAEYSPSADRLGTLYVNDVVKDEEITQDGLSFNPLEYDEVNEKWIYPEGSQVFIRIMTEDLSDNREFTSTSYDVQNLSDTFDDDLKILNYVNTQRVDSHIELEPTYTDGSFLSKDQGIYGWMYYVQLSVDETLATGSSIEYRLVYGDGQNDYIELAKNEKTMLNMPINTYNLQAVLHGSGESPTVNAWHIETMFIPFGDSIVVNNAFDVNGRGFCALSNVVHNSNDGVMELDEQSQGVYYTSGSFTSTLRVTPGDVWEAHLMVDETKPTGTGIAYSISTDGGSSWQAIQPGTDPNTDDWVAIISFGDDIVLKAELTGDGSATPQLNSWTLRCRQTLAGEDHDVELIDEPDELSTLVDANYMTLLRWQPSETEGVTYNVYRSATPYFDYTSMEPLAVGIDTCYWSDYNLNFGETFYYKVTAVKTYSISETEVPRESQPTNEAWATVVSEDELQKSLGLQDYWTYAGFAAGNGTGYVNVANGNMSFVSTDMVIPGPFFGMVMRRTYNLMGNTKTPMGYGWDYSFNTCLFKDQDGNDVILKDGDGSFHRFEWDPATETYQSAKGTFMSLIYDEPTDEYRIERKDYVTYHFDATTMKLKKFTDINGIELTFTYDDRGNLESVENDVGESLTFEYCVDGADEQDPDYIYVNNNIDMLESVTWTQDVAQDPVSITYSYVYDDEDRLIEVHTELDGSDVCLSTFDYDVDLDSDPQTTDRNVVITDAEGNMTVILYDESGAVERIYDPVETLSNLSTAHYNDFDYEELTGDDLTTITSDLGVETEFYHDDNGMLTQYVNALGQTIAYANDGTNLLVDSMEYQNTIDGVDTIIQYAYVYDTNGNITQVKAYSKEDGAQNFTALGPETNFTYDTNFPNKIATQTVKKDSSTTITTSYTYNTNGSLHYLSVADGTDEEKVTEYQYYGASDSDGLQYQLKSVEDEFGKETRYVYNDKGQVVHIDEYDADNTYVRTAATYAYDAYGQTDTVSDAYDRFAQTPVYNVIDLDYDDLGRLIMQTNPDDSATQWVYDLNGNNTEVDTGYMDGSTYTSRNVVSNAYDQYDRITTSTVENNTGTEDDVVTSVSYQKWDSTQDVAGNDADKVVVTDPEGVQTIYKYNIIGQLVKTEVYDGTTTLTVAEYEYDDAGNRIKITDGASRVSKAYYNELNQQIRTIVDPAVLGETDHLNLLNIYTYDYLGNVTSDMQRSYDFGTSSYTDYVTTYTYDNLSRLTSVSQANPNYGDPGEPEYLTTHYTYDEAVTVGSDDLILNTYVDAMDRVQGTYFDEMGRKVMDVNYGDVTWNQGVPDLANDNDKKTTAYDYDIRFMPTEVTRVDGSVEAYQYNEMGQVTQVDYYAQGEQTPGNTIEYDYNDYGELEEELITEGANTHTTSYRYDKMGRVESTWDGTPGLGGLDVEYKYNNNGQVTELEYRTLGTNEHKLVYIYDGYGRISKIQLDPVIDLEDPEDGDDNTVREYIYDATNGDLDYVKTYRAFTTYDNNTENNPAYIKTDYTFNNAGMTEQITVTDADFIDANNTTGITEQYTVEYDGRGYIDIETLETDYSTSEDIETVYKGYEYDEIGRLVFAGNGDDIPTDPNPWDNETTYEYDGVGNRLEMDDGTDVYEYEYNGYNQLLTIDKNSVLYEEYGYDARGNQDYIETFDSGTTTKYEDYTFDLLNRLTETVVDDRSLSYDVTTKGAYNAAGQRIEKEIWSDEGGTDQLIDTTKYFYTGSSVLYTTDDSNIIKTDNILDLGGNIVASWRDRELGSEDVYFYNYDIRGSVTNIVTTSGGTEKGYEYDEFGNAQVSGSASFLNETGYTGSILDDSTGLVYMNARFYDPSTGRFLSQDTYSGSAYQPWTQHLYSYCGNNPANYVDPTGHMPEILNKLLKMFVAAFKEYKKNPKEEEKVDRNKVKINYTVNKDDPNLPYFEEVVDKQTEEINKADNREYDIEFTVNAGIENVFNTDTNINVKGDPISGSIAIIDNPTSASGQSSGGATGIKLVMIGHKVGPEGHTKEQAVLMSACLLIEETAHSLGMYEEHYPNSTRLPSCAYAGTDNCRFAGTCLADDGTSKSSNFGSGYELNKLIGDLATGKGYIPCGGLQ